MSWFNKIMWGAVGYSLGGPLGAVIGAMAAQAFDQNVDEIRSQNRAQRVGMDVRERQHLVFFATAFSMLGRLAKADGQVSREEIRVVEDFINQSLTLSDEQRKAAIHIFSEAKTSDHSFVSFAQQFYEVFGSQPQMTRVMLTLLYRVAMADGVFHPKERELLDQAATAFRISASEHEQIRSLFIPDTDGHYRTLGCEPDDSMATIKGRYRALVTEYHPDKLVAQGMPEEFVQLATEKVQKINEAYEVIQKERAAS